MTSPFALLANLVGAEADELEYVAFDPGRSDLSPPELEKAGKIAEALLLRPELALEIGGVYAGNEDGAALRTARVDALIESGIETLDNDAMYAENRQTVIERLFVEAGIAADATVAVAELRATHTSPDTEDGPGAFDALAYTEDLRRQLIDAETITSDEFVELANARSAAVKEAIVAIDPSLSHRVVFAKDVAEIEFEDGSVPMRVRLTTGDELGVQVPQDVSSANRIVFECADGGPTISMRFEGPEAIVVDDGSSEWLLQRERSASGARYTADDVEFWNQGDEAMFTHGATRFTCLRNET